MVRDLEEGRAKRDVALGELFPRLDEKGSCRLLESYSLCIVGLYRCIFCIHTDKPEIPETSSQQSIVLMSQKIYLLFHFVVLIANKSLDNIEMVFS